MNSIHVEAYIETVCDQLQSKDTSGIVIHTLKKVGFTGGAFLGAVTMGPMGIVIGGGIGGGVASEKLGPDKNIDDMVVCLRGLEFQDKSLLVRQLEEVVGDTDTEELVKFCRN